MPPWLFTFRAITACGAPIASFQTRLRMWRERQTSRKGSHDSKYLRFSSGIGRRRGNGDVACPEAWEANALHGREKSGGWRGLSAGSRHRGSGSSRGGSSRKRAKSTKEQKRSRRRSTPANRPIAILCIPRSQRLPVEVVGNTGDLDVVRIVVCIEARGNTLQLRRSTRCPLTTRPK